MMTSPLPDVQALLCDVFGTVVDWHASVIAELEALGKTHGIEGDWALFANTWRKGYLENTRRIADGGNGPSSVDVMHREARRQSSFVRFLIISEQILEDILSKDEWKQLGDKLDSAARDEINLAWHRLHGWPDSTPGLYALKKKFILAALSNGNVRLLIDMAKFANLPWDVVFSSELFASYKPNPKVYLGAAQHLSLNPENCAMVAAHAFDLRAAAALGMRTVYIPRPGEEPPDVGEVKSKAEGGDVDIVVDSFEELARLMAV
ncbi:Haloacid type II [Mycena kentingensis (nom. inval.)]|nr:Haloacid type II [Mycena kentingensis (nom. inval.)]